MKRIRFGGIQCKPGITGVSVRWNGVAGLWNIQHVIAAVHIVEMLKYGIILVHHFGLEMHIFKIDIIPDE